MPNIESSGQPLVFKVREGPPATAAGGEASGWERKLALRVEVRSLEGMQKEAVVSGPGGSTWRMVSDEGPYLNGTDLAPFPLAFFTAGMQFSFLSQLLQAARAHNVDIKSLALSQDNWYTMNGSAIRGDMIGGAQPPELHLKIESDAPPGIVARLVRLAEASSPAQAVVRDVLTNTFALSLNGYDLPVTDVRQSPKGDVPDPRPVFETLQPDPQANFRPEIISKVSSAKKVFGVEGGAASSLQAEQKRTLHVHGEARLLEGMLMETVIQLFKPIGSTFRFVCDESRELGGEDSAPPPLAYLSAGIGFCYMTQLGRYAHIAKQNLESVCIVQENIFKLSGAVADWTLTASAEPVDTHVFVAADETDDAARKLLSMGERTCFLHAAMRGSYRSSVQAELNGQELSTL